MAIENLITKTTDLALKIVEDYLHPGDVVIDATAGNGHDALYLWQKISPGKLYLFDIQEKALTATKKLLQNNGINTAQQDNKIIFCCDSHSNMEQYVYEKGQVSAIVFNLGYLPAGDKRVTTETQTTLLAVKQSLKLIRKNGIISLTVYSGHETGKKEKADLLEFAAQLSAKEYHVAYVNLINQQKNPPEIIFITKKV